MDKRYSEAIALLTTAKYLGFRVFGETYSGNPQTFELESGNVLRRFIQEHSVGVLAHQESIFPRFISQRQKPLLSIRTKSFKSIS